MRTIFILVICLISFLGNAQTAKELVGKWKLVKWTENGKEKNIQEYYKTDQVYQIFMEDNSFQGVVGDKTKKGKWKLSDDNKVLTVKVSIISIKFQVEYFDTKKRIISSDQLGTLEYEKVN